MIDLDLVLAITWFACGACLGVSCLLFWLKADLAVLRHQHLKAIGQARRAEQDMHQRADYLLRLCRVVEQQLIEPVIGSAQQPRVM